MAALDLDFTITDITLDMPEATGGDVDLEFEDVQQVTTSDHNKLQNRELADQHPIKAITGLTEELDDKLEGETITNEEIDSLWKLIIG